MALSGLVSRATSGLDQREVRDVLEGHLTTDHAKPASKYVRIFLSSELTDSVLERQFFRERVFPRLRRFSRSLGLQFHAVDLYHCLPACWLGQDMGGEGDKEKESEGEREEGEGSVEGEDGEEEGRAGGSGSGMSVKEGGESVVMCELELQGVLQLALWEIRACQELSTGPTFLTLLGQKYGYKPLPLHIPEGEYSLLCGAMEDTAECRQLVQQWYQLDSNAQPPQYTLLQPLQDHIGDWVNIQNSLSKAIRRAAKVALGNDPSKVQKYIMSASEEEVSVGIFQLKADPNHCCVWSKRTFTNLLEQKPSDPALTLFSDLVVGQRGLEFDAEAMKSLNHLKEARMTAKYIGLDVSNIFEFLIKWQRGRGVDPSAYQLHEDYLIQMCEKVSNTFEQHISDAADILGMQSSNTTYQEVLVHAVHCRKIAKSCMDRPAISEQIQSYLDGSSAHPLVVHGPTGYGKTTLMALAAYHLREKNPVKNMAIVVRFLGLTPHSSSIFHTLRSISEQIAAVYDVEEEAAPGDYQGMSSHFASCLHRASADQPIYLFLDAVDQLSPEDGASGMSWLPLTLPSHVKLVLSTSSEIEYRCFPVLQSLLAKHAENLVQVSQLSEVECQQIIAHCLSLEQRQLIPQQMRAVLEALQQCPVPLFLQLIMRQFKSLKSYSQVPDSLPMSIDGAIESLYTELEEKYGRSLISHLLAYVTASKSGLTEPEILDILALDPEVMAEVNVRYSREGSATLVSLPPVIWAQLCHQLHPLLEHRPGVDYSLVLQWSHRRLREVTETRYLTHHRAQVYGMLADYFGSKNSEKQDADQDEEKHGTEDSSTLQYEVDSQPLLLNESLAQYNIRKLTELPHALARSSRYEALTELLTDYQWLKACILSLPCRDILHDFTPLIPTVPICRATSSAVDHELRLLRQAIIYSTNVLNTDGSQFCVQLAGRLLAYISKSPDKYPVLRNLVTTALQDTKPLLTPLQPFSHVPGGPHLVGMEGHRDTVSCVATALVERKDEASLIIVSSSWDKTLKSWDLATTGVLKTFDGHSDRVLSVALSADGVYAASGSEDKSVRYWYVPTAECLHAMQGHTAVVNAVAVTADGCKTISAASDATVKVWNTNQTSSSSGQLIYTMRSHKKPVLTVTLKDDILASGTSNGGIFLTNIVSGEQLKMVQGHDDAVTALASEEVDGCCYLVSGSADGSVKVWDCSTCSLVHTLPPQAGITAAITSICIGPNGKLLVSNGQREPVVWDLKSGGHLYNLPGHAAGVHSMAITDSGKLAITGSTGPSLQIWDILSPPVSHTTRLHTDDVTSVALSGCGGLGVCASRHGTICVFETDTMTILQELQPHSAAVSQVLGYKDADKVLSASGDGTICLWSGGTGEILTKFEEQEEKSPVNCLAITASKDLLMSGRENGEVTFWNIHTGKKLKTFSDHSTGVLAVAFIKQKKDQFMFSCSKDGELCIREFQTAKIVVSTRLHTGELVSAALAPNATFMVSGSKESAAYVISLPYGTLTAILTGHSAAVNSVKVFSDSTKCVTGSADCTIRVWSIDEAKCLAVLHVDTPVLTCDVNYNTTILYGTEGGWVSTAAFQSDLCKPNALISRLNARNLPTIASQPAASQSPHGSREEVAQSNERGDNHVESVEATNQGEDKNLCLQPNSENHKTIPIPLIPQPDDAINEKLGLQNHTKIALYGYSQNGRITDGTSIGSVATTESSITSEVNTTTANKESLAKTAHSSACTLL